MRTPQSKSVTWIPRPVQGPERSCSTFGYFEGDILGTAGDELLYFPAREISRKIKFDFSQHQGDRSLDDCQAQLLATDGKRLPRSQSIRFLANDNFCQHMKIFSRQKKTVTNQST
jgi:hypothetical protein